MYQKIESGKVGCTLVEDMQGGGGCRVELIYGS